MLSIVVRVVVSVIKLRFETHVRKDRSTLLLAKIDFSLSVKIYLLYCFGNVDCLNLRQPRPKLILGKTDLLIVFISKHMSRKIIDLSLF
jgi:hypothetical protein